MPSPFLASDGATATNQLLRYSNATPANVGVAFGSGFSFTGFNTSFGYAGAGNFAVAAGTGYQRFIVLGSSAGPNLTINRTNDGGATWSTRFTSSAAIFNGFGAAVPNKAWGPFGVYVGGVLTLVVVWVRADSAMMAARSTDGGETWTETASAVGVSDPIGPALYRGSFYIGGRSSSTVWTYNPASNTFASLSTGFDAGTTAVWVGVFNDRLIAYSSQGAGFLNRVVREFSGGTWTLLATIATGVGSGLRCGGMLMPDGNDLWCFWFNATAGGFRASKSAGSNLSSWTNDNTPIPLALQSGQTELGMFCPWVDAELTPGSYPSRYVFFTPTCNAPGALTLYQWNGASVMTTVDSGGDIYDFLSVTMTSQGSSFNNTGERKIEMISRTPVTGGERWTFRLYSPNPSVDSVNVRVWVGTAQDEFPLTQAPLSNPTNGTISGGNVNTGLDAADNGTTLFAVTVGLQSLGFAPGQRRKLVMDVYS